MNHRGKLGRSGWGKLGQSFIMCVYGLYIIFTINNQSYLRNFNYEGFFEKMVFFHIYQFNTVPTLPQRWGKFY